LKVTKELKQLPGKKFNSQDLRIIKVSISRSSIFAFLFFNFQAFILLFASSFFVLSLFLTPTLCYADDVRIIETSSNGLAIQFDMPELKSEVTEIDGKTFQKVSFDKCSFTYEPGKPQVPMLSLILGIPKTSEPSASVLNITNDLLNGFSLPINKDEALESSPEKTYSTRASGFYPSELVKIMPMGYMRQQRIARLEIYPIQYNASNAQLKVYKSLKIGITFSKLAPSSISQTSIKIRSNTNESKIYEDIYKGSLLNYDQAKKWRMSIESQPLGSELQYKVSMAPSALAPTPQNMGYKITIDKNGIYKLDYNYLINAGIDPSTIDPRKIELKTGGKQVPIYVEGYNDGKFDLGDYIEFYGIKMNSIYTNENVYWLNWATMENPNIKSWMMTTKDGKPENSIYSTPLAYFTTEHFEENNDYDPLKKETSETADHFFWRPFRGQDSRYDKMAPMEIALPFRAPNIMQNFTLRVCFQGVTFAKGSSKHIMKIFMNGNLMDTAIWDGPGEYISESVIRQIDVNRSNWLEIECDDKNDTKDDTDPKWDVFLNWVEVDYWHEFVTNNNILEFSTETLPAVTKDTLFSVSKLTKPDVEVFQIDKLGALAKIINPEVKQDGNTYIASFEDSVTQPTRYYVTTVNAIMRPKSIVKDEPSTLHNPANRIDYIMITHSDFRRSTEKLADFRRKQGLDVIVVDINDVYDEFSYGVFDPKAIQRFLRYAYFNWEKIPSYVLLVGDAHWDYKYVYDEYYKKYDQYPRIYVPTYHAQSVPYGETAMDQRFVEVSGDDIIPDMMIGRFAVDTLEEADIIVDKTIEYETKPNYGIWQSKVMLVADDEKSKSGDEIFEDSRRELASDFVPVGYESIPIYLRVLKEPYLAKNAIIQGINTGVVFLEFSGHGGSYYWTHENIFDGDNVKKLKNSVYPIVVTTTCENGYFDNPQGGNKTIVDLFMIQPKAGAVACLSATRLTYGQGNAVFDKKLYPYIFNEKPPILGKIINQAKVDFIKMDIPAWTSSVEQYTIFGDPALKINLPELKIDCELGKSSVSVGSKIDLKSGYVKRLEVNQITGVKNWMTDTSFNGQLQMSVVYPNNLDENELNNIPVQIETTKVSKGEFKNVSVKITDNVIPGKASLRFFSSGDNSSAIGGIKLSISEPVIESIISKIINDESLQVYVAITDNLGEAGIKSVECDWRNTETWKEITSTMEPGSAPDKALSIEGTWYVLKEKIPLSKPGTKIDYRIRILDNEGNKIMTEYDSVLVPIGVNLTIPRPTVYAPPEITYSYSPTDKSWLLSAPVVNTGSKEIKLPVGVYFFEGNPDKNNDQTVDLDAKLLGNTVITYDQWKPDETSDPPIIQKTIATIKLSEGLYSGFHQIFVWVNPDFYIISGQTYTEKVDDADVMDNLGSKLFQINEFIIGKKDKDTYAQSLDGIMKMIIPAGSVDETVMSITRLAIPEGEWKQQDLTPAPMPNSNMDVGAFKMQLNSGVDLLNKESQIDIKFDVAKVREIAKKAKGLANKKDTQLTYTEREWIETAMQEEAKKLGIYSWQDELGVWKYVPSQLIMSNNSESVLPLLGGTSPAKFAQEYYVTLTTTENKSDSPFDSTNIKVDEISAPIGNWVILFLTSDRYKIYFRREGLTSYESLNRYGEVDTLYDNTDVGLQLMMNEGNKEFAFGDIYKFDTYRELDGTIKIKRLEYYNYGDGTAHITNVIQEEGYITQIPGSWVIFFVDSKSFEIHSQLGVPVLDDEGQPLLGTIGKEVYIPNPGIKVEINEGKYPFEFGDKFLFQTLFTGTVRAKISNLKTVTLMQSNDVTQPGVELWVNGLIPQSGVVISPKPTMSLMLSDANGVDINSFSFMISVNDRDFHEVPKSDYVLSERSQLDSIPIFYSPVLNIGKYRYRISVKDFAGNISKSDNGDFLEFMFLVEDKPDLNPPIIKVTVDGKLLTDGEIFQKSPVFNINVSDDSILDMSKFVLSMSGKDEELKPIDKKEYSMNVSSDQKNATIIYSPQLMNGIYVIQIQAVDTSENSSFLSPQNLNPTRFSVDEKVEVTEIMNAPNPFSDTTVFSYYLTQPADKIVIKIYTLRGRLIRTIEQDSPRWKYNEEFWDGKDEDGNKLASGVYLYKFIVYDNDRKMEKVSKLAIIR